MGKGERIRNVSSTEVGAWLHLSICRRPAQRERNVLFSMGKVRKLYNKNQGRLK